MNGPDWQLPADPEILIADIQPILGEGIPVSGHMGIAISHLDRREIRLYAPLAPNTNHMGTGFAGSIASLATLTAWSACQVFVHGLGPNHAMAHDVNIRYRAPVTDDMEAVCLYPAAHELVAFRTRMEDRGRAHAQLSVSVYVGGRECAVLTGRFVAVLEERPGIGV